ETLEAEPDRAQRSHSGETGEPGIEHEALRDVPVPAQHHRGRNGEEQQSGENALRGVHGCEAIEARARRPAPASPPAHTKSEIAESQRPVRRDAGGASSTRTCASPAGTSSSSVPKRLGCHSPGAPSISTRQPGKAKRASRSRARPAE